MAECKRCVSEKVCRYNDGHNLYCKEDYECPHFKNKDDVAEVRHGEWINGKWEDGDYKEQCSRCYEWSGEYYRGFCSSCGAKMDGKENE